ncbi:adenylate/guanylate cyclase domain-containing protein [Hyalangium rubrum]|uniref:Adenylate/guanylate cyclase domain-containing protein n=1 Tax=Hyalangium rubrum TaxID=3103134 RepID=A0ABU5GVD5_9BACT|nr:adenylate/guanylate cyclase domain-containing protein [Hyalangium sp. s54d21]MDY7225135.1 adenylate/guanylate cyclase domain-containing protein [Hyalangium sp. s54d21]
MQNPPVQSSGRRFLKRLGFALLQAIVFGAVFGGLMYARVPRTQLEVEGAPQAIRARLAEWIESPERITYDFRVRILGERLQRQRAREAKAPDRVVMVTVDDDTLANARESDHPGLPSYPWPREIIGGMTRRLVQEGASLVLLDMVFPELSPRECSTRQLAAEGTSDDTAFRELLNQEPGRTVMAFSWSVPRASLPPFRLWPYRVRLGIHPGQPQARAQAQTVLSSQRPAFLIPVGNKVEVWAGVEDEREGQVLSAQFGTGAGVVQERRAADDAWRVTPLDLFVSLAEVEVEGLDPTRLLQVRTLQHPVVPLLGPQSLYGAVSGFPDPDGVNRGMLHLVSYTPREGEHHVLPSMPLAAAMKAAGTRKLRYANGRLQVGDAYSVPMDETGFSLTRWDAGDAGRSPGASVIRYVRAWNVLINLFDVLEDRPPRSDHDLEGRTVILTNTSTYATDYKPTPIGKATPGGAVIAQALDNILLSQGITRAPPKVDLFATVMMAFVGAAIALIFSRNFRSAFGAFIYFSSGALAGVGYLVAAVYVFVQDQMWIAVAAPLLAMVGTFLLTTIYAVRTEREIRDFVNHALGRYVSPEVARLVTRDLTLLVRPERRQMSVYFSDIEGFTRLSEQMEPERLVQFLNEYLTVMTMAVRSSGGQVDKYIGDAVMAFWGAPVRTDRHAHLACEAALKMRAVLVERQPHWEKTYGHRIQFRAGINSGEVVVGDMGSDLKSNYTVMGDAVNLASRLEGANKAYGTYMLVGENTAQLARDAYVFREVDRVLVKGKTVATRIHELLGRHGEIAPRMQEQLAVYEQALTSYHQRRFDEALALFERGTSEYQDPVAAVYAGRCRRFLVTAPAEDWDGVYALEEK